MAVERMILLCLVFVAILRVDALVVPERMVLRRRAAVSVVHAQSIRAMQLELEAMGYDSRGIFERAELERALMEARGVQKPKRGLRAVAARGREMSRAMELSEDELRAILVGRGVTAREAFESKRAMARTLADVRLKDPSLEARVSAKEKKVILEDFDIFSARPASHRRVLPSSSSGKRSRFAEEVDNVFRETPRAFRIVANDLVIHLDRFADSAARTADKVMTAATSEETARTLERHRNSLWSRASSLTSTVAQSLPHFRSVASAATKRTGSILRRPRLLPFVFESIFAALLAIGDWAAGPHLRREVVFFVFFSALAIKGPVAAFATLFVFRVLRDVFARIDTFLAEREYYQHNTTAASSFPATAPS